MYASTQGDGTFGICLLCTIVNGPAATDGDINTSSKVTAGVSLLGGGIYQELIYPAGDLPGGSTGSVVKISTGTVLELNVLGAIKVQAYNNNTPVGAAVNAGAALLNLLANGNQAEIFLPAPGAAYNRVRVIVDGGALAALTSINVYHAYFLKNTTNINCDAPIDELHGISGTVGALGGVSNPLNAIDGVESTYSTLGSAVGLVGYAQQTIVFPGLSAATDSVRLLVSSGPTLLSLELLGSVAIETFNGNVSNGLVPGTGGLLNLKLLNPGSSIGVLTFAPGVPFDRVQLRIGGIASLLNSINLHEVSRSMALPTTININSAASASGIACAGDGVVLNINSPEAGATYTWYTQAIGGTGTAGVSFTPSGLVTGVNNFYVSGKRAGCTNESPRKLVSITVNNPILPVVSAVTPICSGSTATLQIGTPVVGETYRWYDAAVGGTLAFTGETFVTPVLTANKSYYVESVIGACVSARQQVDVIVNPLPADAQVSSTNVNISTGQTATLSATAPTAGSTINWYTVATGGSPIATGTSFTTPPLTENTTYYVGTQSAGGCVSQNRVAVNVIVTNVTPGVTCKSANAQSNGIQGICIGCEVSDPNFSVDADPLNFSSIRLAVGVLGVGYQRLIFPTEGVATDSIRLDLRLPGNIVDLSLIGGISVLVKKGDATVASYELNSELIHLTLSGGDRFKVTIPAGANYDAVEVRFGAVLSAVTALDIFGAEVIYPSPTIASTGLAICSGASTTLTATPNGGTDLKWYAAATGGPALATGNTFSPTGLTATTTYYIEVGKGTCVNTQRIPVTVTVNPAIVFVAAALSNATLASTYSKQIPVATGGTPAFNYTLAPGSTLPAGLTLSATGLISGTPTAAGPYTFSVLATDSKGCTATAEFNLTVTDALSLPSASLPNGTVGVVYPVQTLPEAIGGTGPYTYVATNLPPGLAFNPATREITGTPTQAGTYIIPVTVTDANGNTKTENYTIVVRDPLALPAATLANGTVGIPYPTQAIPAATGGIGPYTYTAPAASLPPGLSFNPNTREITGTPTLAGTYTIPVTVTDGDGKTITTNYTIVVGSPLVLPPATLADGNVNVGYTSQPIPAATGGTAPYTYAATNLPPGLSFDAVTRVISGTPTQSGLYSITVTVTDDAGTTASNTYSLRVIGALSLPTMALADGTVGTVYTEQTLPEVTGGTGPYTYTAANLPPGMSFDPITRKLTGTPTTGGTFTFSVTAKDAANNSTTTTFTVKVKVDAPVVASASICSGSTATLNVTNTLPGVTYNWYASTGSTPIFTGPTYTTPTLTANTTYYVEAVSGTAVSSRTAVTVTARPTPALAVVSANQSISAGQTATLQASAEAGNTISWFAAATGGAALGTGTSFTTPVLNTTTTYYVETANSTGCVSATRVPVTVTVTSGPVNPNCNAATSQTTAIESLLCVGCGITNPSGSIDADPATFTTINLAVNVAGVGYQKLMFPNQGTGTDSIRVDIETPVGLADINLLNGATITVYNGTTIVKTYPLNSSLLNLELLSGNRFQATFPATGAYNAVEIRFGSVVGLLSSYRIYGASIIYPNPTVATTGQTICAGNTTTLSATANGGTTLKWYATASSGTALATGETFTTPVLNATTTYYIEVSKAGCANVERVPVTVTVTPAPTAPVLATVLPICHGSTASLAVNAPVTGVNYNWYTVATGGTSIFTGSTFVTPALTANTTYYVEAANPGCGVSTRTAVPVTVNPIVTLPQIQASATTVAPGQTVILNATSPDADVTFNWFTSATATTPTYTGPTYVTEPITATTTYYLEAKSNATGCVSASRVQVTISVDNSLPSPVPCVAAITETHNVVGVALLSAIFNPQLAIDNDTRTGSSLVMPVGLLGASVYQRLGFGSVSSPGDTVKVLLNAPGKLLTLGLLSSIQVGTYNGATSNNDAVSLNNNLISLELLSNNSQALVSFVPTAPFDQVEVRLNSGLAGVLSTVDVNYARRVLVAPELVVPAPAICATQTATLTVKNPNAGITYKWYNSTGATLLFTGTTFTTPALAANTTYYVEANTASGCTSYKTKVVVTVTPAPAVPELVTASVNTCVGSTVTLEVKNPLAGITYKWYDATGTTELATGITFISPALTANISYQVAAVSTACNVASAAKATAQITVNGLDQPVITPADAIVSSGSPAVLTATSSTAGVIFKWYDAPGSVIPVYTGANYVTAPLINTGTTPIVFTYYVSAEIAGGCTSTTRATVTVTVLPAVDPNNDLACEVATIRKRDGVDGVALLAGVFNPTLATDLSSATASSLVMSVGALGASTYQHVGFTGLSVIGDTVRIRITSPGKLLSLAVLPSIEITTYKDLTSNNDMMMVSDSNPLIKLDLLSDNSGATISFVPQKQFDGVELRLRSGLASVLSTLDFNYARRILVAPTVLSANVSACLGTAATLSVQNPIATGTTYTWYKGTAPASVGTGATFLTETTLAVGTHDYFVTASRNGCVSTKTKVTVTILAAPGAPVEVAGNPKSTCFNTPATLAVTPVAGITYNWFDALTAGNKLASNTNTYTTLATLAPGTYNFYVEASNANSCISTAARTKITLVVKPIATPADVIVAGAATPLCKDSKAKLTASSTTVTNPTFVWYSDAALTTEVFRGAIFEPTVTANVTYYVSVFGDNKCTNASGNGKAVALTVNPPATAADLAVTGNGAPFCAGAKATLTASTTTVTNPTFIWYSDAALTTEVFRGSIYEPTVTATTTYYVTVSGSNKCPNLPANAKVVAITVNNPGSAADITVIGNGTPFCAGTKAKLTASATTVTNPKFIWYSDAALTTEVFRGAIYEPTVTASTTYYVSVSGDNRCPNDPANAKVVTITVNPPATAADIAVTGNNAPFCAGTKAKFTASSTTVTSPVFTWYNDADLTDVAFTGPVFEPVLSVSATYYVTVRGANKCENLKAGAKLVTVVINPPATAADIAVAGNNAPFCAGSKAILTASSITAISPVFTWFKDAALTDVAFTGPVFEPVLTATTTYYVTVSGSNKCANAAGDAKIVTLIVNPPATASDIIVTGVSGPVCAGAIIKLTASSTTVTNPVFTWYTDAALTNAVFTGPVFDKTITASITYYVTVKGANKCENLNGTAKAVAITVNPPATAADVTVTGNGTPFCAGAKAKLIASSTTVTNPVFIWYSNAALTTEVFRGATYEPTVTASTTYYVTVSGDNKCPNDPANAKVVTITVNPPATAADVAITGNDAPFCAGTKAKFTASSTTVTSPVFTWYTDAALTNAVFTGPVFEPVLTANITYYVTVRGTNKCESLAAGAKVVTVVINPPATSADIAVTGNSAPFCAGAKATLTASSTTVTSPVFTWYKDAALTDVAFTGAIFEPVLTATTTYYVTVRGANRCENAAANAKIITLTVNPPATASDVIVTGVSGPVCAGVTIKLTASSTTVTNPVFTWYTDAALTNAVFTGPVFDKTITTAITYYVTVKGANKCENLNGTAKAVAITVNPPATAADVTVTGNGTPFCAGAKAKLIASSTTVTNPVFIWYSNAALTTEVFRGATYEPTVTASTTYYVTVSGDNKCPNDPANAKVVTITVNPPATAADVAITGNDAPFCAGTKAKFTASSTTVTSPVFTWYTDAALTNAVFTGPVFEPVLTANITYYVTVRGTNKCESLAAGAKVVTVVINPPATSADIAVTGNSAPFCAGAKATLTASSTTVTSPVFTWYKDAALTDVAFTGAIFEPVLTATTTYYVTVRGANRCENAAANAKIITLTVNPPATASDVIVTGVSGPVCAGVTIKLTASSTTVTNPVFTWYTDAALTNAVFTGPVFDKTITTAITYYVTVKGANKCENLNGTAKAVAITVNPPATAADVTVTGNGTPFCAGAKAKLIASSTTVTNPVFIWYSNAALTTEVFRGATYEPTVTASTTYYVTVSGDNKCPNDPANAKVVTITVNPPATAADVAITGNDAPFCAGTKAKFTASSTTVTSPVFTWYTDAALTNAVFTGPVFEPVLTANITYYVTVRGTNKCESLAAGAKVVTVVINPSATSADIAVTGNSAPFCAGAKATLTASSTTVTSPVFTWYKDAALTNVAFTGAIFEPVLTATTTYYVTVRGANRCENATANAKIVTLTVNPPATASDVVVSGADLPVCAGATVKLTASSTTVTNPVFTWYSDAALTDAVFTGTILEKVLTETTTYYVTVKGNNRCESLPGTAKVITVTVNPLPNVPVIANGGGATICSGDGTTLNIQNPQPGITFQWYSAAVGGTLLGTGSSLATGPLTVTTDYYVLATSASGCGSATGRVKATVTVNTKPTVPTVVSAIADACPGSTAVLSVSNPLAGVTYSWYADPTEGTALGTGANFTTPVITANRTFYVGASTATCSSVSRTAVNVRVQVSPDAPASVNGATDPSCSGNTIVLSVNNPNAAFTYHWYSSAAGGTSLAEGSSFTTPALTATTTYYVESVNTATGCVSTSRTAAVITILPKLTAPVVSVQSATATSVTFAWATVAGATGYEVSVDGGTTWSAPSSGAAGLTHVISGLKPDQSVTIRVRATGQLPCQLSDASSLNSKSENPLGNQIFIPNTFTPNNDGKNDVLYVYGNTIAKMKLRVYNQWGQFIYESLSVQNGWDGTYKGDIQPNGVYVYLLEAEFNDGTKTTKKGTITLLR
ncbi:putative Ig domain-containing protein [Pedobacter steynii]|uniref:Fibronectin type-III domain-containing protein n=1 Tax=Pedobacter steynii TaxID=430522 RepID=A0A1D7QEB1_9SPHI|nr:putative Ig domain-containing protein [Pedobacter steynii]AOM77022.1 hypothetical protein BFS30_07490 [Pedobacter steynii]